MAAPTEKLAQSLSALKVVQETGRTAIHTSSLSRTHRERLLKNGFIQEIMKGWYVPSRPDDKPGESTAWYASFWGFCSDYLDYRFSESWCLSPEQSLNLHTGNWSIPRQLLVRTPKGGNKPISLPHDTSLFDLRLALPHEDFIVVLENMRILSLPMALVNCPPPYFKSQPLEIRAALSMINEPSDLLRILLEGHHNTIAGRLAGAFRNIGREKIADEILDTMISAGHKTIERNPFEQPSPIIFKPREISPYVNRFKMQWETYRQPVIDNFLPAPNASVTKQAYLKSIDEIYTSDAYHSLSIEGYRVTTELIDKVKRGNWNPDQREEDSQQRDALAARGYWQAFQAAKKTIAEILDGENPGAVVEKDYSRWYRELFGPSVAAGIIKAGDLAGFRNQPVYIRQSMHTPPSSEAVRDLIPAFFELLQSEENAAVRVVLGHFFFVYIHPYIDGNGRMARFLMNAMAASGGYPWIVVPVEQRSRYMHTLESASVQNNIVPFTLLLAELLAGVKHKHIG